MDSQQQARGLPIRIDYLFSSQKGDNQFDVQGGPVVSSLF